MKNKRIIALIIASVLIFGGTAFALAGETAEGSVVGEGGVEAVLDLHVHKAELPAVTSDALKFTMDPQGLMDSEYHGGAGAVYFLNNTSDVTKSGDITVKNKSSFKAEVVLTIELNTPGIRLVENESDLYGAKVPSMYMAITDGTKTTALSDVTTFSATLDKIEYRFYASATEIPGYVRGESGNYYAYLPVDPSASNDVTFNIFGKCDTTADWSSITDSESLIKITWELKEYEENQMPHVDKTVYEAIPDTPITISPDMGDGEECATGIVSIVYSEDGRPKYLEAEYYEQSDGTIIFSSEFINKVIAGGKTQSITLNFNNTSRTAVEIKIKVN